MTSRIRHLVFCGFGDGVGDDEDGDCSGSDGNNSLANSNGYDQNENNCSCGGGDDNNDDDDDNCCGGVGDDDDDDGVECQLSDTVCGAGRLSETCRGRGYVR